MTSEPELDSGALPPAMLTVAAVARRLGVAPSTLRTWDRRYGLGPSTHTAGSHRRYSPDDVSRLVVMRGLVVEGVPAAEAAQIALAAGVDGGRATPGAPSGTPSAALPGAASRAVPGVGSRAAVLRGAPAGSGAMGAPGTTVGTPVGTAAGTAGTVAPSSWATAARMRPPSQASRAVPGPDGPATRAVWPVSPLAAQHLLQSVDPVPAMAGGPAEELLDPVAVEAVGRDASLAGLITEVLRRPPRATGRVGGGRVGGGRVISLPDASPRARGLARAAMSLDTQELGRLLRDAVGVDGVIRTWESMVMPVLRGLGDRWAATADGIDVEHAFSEATLGVLRGVGAAPYRPRNARPVLLACADSDQHVLPLHALSAALAEAEIGCRVLGVGLPASALVAATRRIGPAVVFIYAQLPVADADPLREFSRQRPAPRVLVGGPGWEDVPLPPGVVRVDSLRAAVREVQAAVQL